MRGPVAGRSRIRHLSDKPRDTSENREVSQQKADTSSSYLPVPVPPRIFLVSKKAVPIYSTRGNPVYQSEQPPTLYFQCEVIHKPLEIAGDGEMVTNWHASCSKYI